ncbi:MAG: division/cell wall cluster transcriptional repressor MraZ [Vicinamibacterales bacterium]
MAQSGLKWSQVGLRGSHEAKIDDKGRLKVPSQFRELVEPRHGTVFFITSLDGETARVYPMPEWEAIELRIAAMPSTDPTRERFLHLVNYYGQTVEMDNQGRVLIPARLRTAADLTGDVDVQGHVTYLVVLNRERSQARTQASLLSTEDKGRLTAFGI